MLKRLIALLFALALSAQEELCFASDDKVGLETMGIYQETTCVRRLTDPDSLANPRLFRALKNVYVYSSADAQDSNIDNTRAKLKLKQIGIHAVSREVGLNRELPWIDFEIRPDSSGKGHNGYSGEAGRVFRSYSATQNDSVRPPAKGHVRQP